MTTTPSNLHVVFGTGPVGRHTARALREMGYPVRMVNRSGRGLDLPEGVELVAGDAYDAAGNIRLTQGAVAVYQCAQPHYYDWPQKFPPLQAAILEAAAAHGARLVVADNLYMYGHFQGKLTEDAPLRPNSRKGRVRAAMAQAVMDAHAAGRVQAAIGRASDFFGPYDTALTDYAMRPAVAGQTVNLMGDANQPHTFTYVVDFGRLLAALGTRDEAVGDVWFAPSNDPVTQGELVSLMEAELGTPIKVRVGGPWMMRLLGLFNREIRETVEMMYEWTGPFVVDTDKAQRAFGLAPTPMAQAVRETLDWCKQGVD